MKFFAIALLAVVVGVSSADIDWSHAKPIRRVVQPVVSSRRIVNGEIAAPNQFPYQVAILINLAVGSGVAGGSVISSTAVLTAAHNLNVQGNSITLIFGAHNRVIDEPNQQRRTVANSAFIRHPSFVIGSLLNDIAVIRFPENPIILNVFVQAIDLASDPNDLFLGEEVHVSGFGRFNVGTGGPSEVLRFTVKHVVTNAVCSTFFGSLVQPTTICAIGNSQVNNAVCTGDSGGPLAARRNGRSLQIGVVSFGANACAGGQPDGYARVSSFIDWIRSTAQL